MKRILTVGCLVSLWLLSVSGVETSQAQTQDDSRGQISSSADEADVQFNLGNQAYRKRNYRKALSHYFASNRLAPNRNVMFNIARCYEQLKQYAAAFRYYHAFEQPDMAKRERKALKKALNRVRPHVGLLKINTTPPGATIYVKRKDLGGYGLTPTVLALKPGDHRIILEKPGHVPVVREKQTLTLGKQATLDADLDRIVGTLSLSGTPKGARVRVEDPLGAKNLKLPASVLLAPGPHRVQVDQEGYEPFEITIEIKANKKSPLKIELQPKTGKLLVQADERDALILIDGQAAGFTPAVFDKLSVGEHLVEVQQNGFRPYRKTVQVEPEKQIMVQACMEIVEDVSAASRFVESVRDAPASVSLVTRTEMEAFAYTNATDALSGMRGTYPTDDLTYKTVGVRGFSPFGQYGNRVLVQLDGHTLNDDWIGSSYVGYDLMSDLNAIERIELVRGPGSALYGTGAFFGVINMVSPTGYAPRMNMAGLSTVGPGTLRAFAGNSGKIGKDFSYWVSGGGLLGNDFDFFSPTYFDSVEAPDGVARNVGGFNTATSMGKLNWRELTLQWYYNQRRKHVPTGSFETIFGHDETHSHDRRSFVELRYEPRFGDSLQLLSRLYYDHYDYDGAFPYEDEGDLWVSREYYRGDWAGLELRGVLTPGYGLRLTAGGSFEWHFNSPGLGMDDGETEPYYDEVHPFQSFSGYLVADWALLKWLSISAGGRFDGWNIKDLANEAGDPEDRFLYSLNPRLGIILRPSENDTVKILGGSAFRAPSLYEMTYWDGGITQIQSPDINPERIITGELEYTRKLPASFWLTATLFLNRISDLIEQIGEGVESDPLIYRNLDELVWTLGGELELRKEFRRGWLVAVQYSYQRTRVGDITDDQEPANSPEHLAGAKLVLPIVGRYLRLASRLIFEAGRLDRNGDRLDPILLWDLTLSGSVEEWHLKYAAGVRNLLDWRYCHPTGEDVPDPRLRQQGISLLLDLSFTY
ncbi:MAG: TonB-dependent receptor [Deltaproteobacteria bacterium]|nr:TonB-dependent receptor [Deltaproteobacteria bacterium]